MNTLPPKGMRDFAPEIKILRDEVFKKIENVFKRYGFDPIETPIVESWEALKGKYGEEAENRLIWRFQLPYSEKWFALRYDLTVPLARFYAERRPPLPFKRYHIDRVYRYENPQKGRYREFYQCDADVIGAKEPFADIEIIDMMADIFNEFKIPEYTIKLNDRRILKGTFEEKLGLGDSELMLKVFRTIDKLDKIGKRGVINELKNTGLSENKINYISEILETSNYKNEELIDFLKKFENKEVKNGIKLFEAFMDYSNAKDRIKIDLSLVRGLDYYTGMIYEIVVEEPKIGSLSGGGRYDDLIGMFSGKNIPAVGGSIGVERLIDAGLETGIFKIEKYTIADVGIIPLSESVMKYAQEVASELRRNDVNTFIFYESTSPVKGIKRLERKKIKNAIFIGEDEVSKNTVTFQNLETRERKEYNFKELSKIARSLHDEG